MTDNEIIKALEICNSDADAGWCDICPYEGTVGSGCSYNLICDTIAIITRQKARIERLEKQLYGERVYLKQLLPKNFDFEHCTVLEAVVNARTEAIKEFVDRLRNKLQEFDDTPSYDRGYDVGYDNCLTAVEDVIDDIVAEMVGERE